LINGRCSLRIEAAQRVLVGPSKPTDTAQPTFAGITAAIAEEKPPRRESCALSASYAPENQKSRQVLVRTSEHKKAGDSNRGNRLSMSGVLKIYGQGFE
jgi:hypothetical protein